MNTNKNTYQTLSKSKLLAYRQCPKRLWLAIHRKDLCEPDAAADSRRQTGIEVGKMARREYPDGLLIEDDLDLALEQTAEILVTQDDRPLFEAAFRHKGVVVRPDILLPEGNAHRLAEVKSSTYVKPPHIPDVAIQAWVVRGAGVPLSRVEILHIDNSFVYPGDGDYRGLFTQEDITELSDDLSGEIPNLIKEARKTLDGAEPPIAPGDQCHNPYDCPFLHYCCPEPDDKCFPPEILPRGKKVAAELRAEGYEDLRDIPAGRLTHPNHERVWRTTISGTAELDPTVSATLRGYGYPRHFLDFETIQFAVPIWAGTRPYQHIPFQWSCHRESRTGATQHNDFLAEGGDDPRRAFIETLLPSMERDGPIFVYNAGFERTRLKELAAAFPDLAGEIDALKARIADLWPLTRDHYYHPAMRGSWSLKAVLPTIAPELSYDDLEVGDGRMAQLAFLDMIDPQTPADRKQSLKHGLLRYCMQDTLALVKIAHFLEGKGQYA